MGNIVQLLWVVRFDYNAKTPDNVNCERQSTFVQQRPVSDVIKYTSRFEVHKIIQDKKEIDIAHVLACTDDSSHNDDPAGFLRDVLNGNIDYRPSKSSPGEVYQGILGNIATMVNQLESAGKSVCISKQNRIVVDHLNNKSIYVVSRNKGMSQYNYTGKNENERSFWPKPDGQVRLKVF